MRNKIPSVACVPKCVLVVGVLLVFDVVLFGVLMLIGRLPIQQAFVCHDCAILALREFENVARPPDIGESPGQRS